LAFDTIGIRSPFLDEILALAIEKECIRRQGIDLKTGEQIYSITTGQLQGSHDSRISVKVDREQWSSDGRGLCKTETEPYVYIEASVHKAMMGHNCWGGPTDFNASVNWLIGLVENLTEKKLPQADEWMVRRADVAECYELDSFEACQEWFRGLNNAEYPRREVNRYGLSGLYAPGVTTCIKFYHKGPEFWKHDRKRLKKFLKESQICEIQERANKIIRVEVEVKSKKIEYNYGRLPKIDFVDEGYFEKVHDEEVKRILREGEKGMDIVREMSSVENRLYKVYDESLAKVLLGSWYVLSTMGEKQLKQRMKKSAYYNHVKWLKEAGVSWLGTDVKVQDTYIVPVDFAPVRNDMRRLTEISPVVQEKILLYKTA